MIPGFLTRLIVQAMEVSRQALLNIEWHTHYTGLYYCLLLLIRVRFYSFISLIGAFERQARRPPHFRLFLLSSVDYIYLLAAITRYAHLPAFIIDITVVV